jgi:hypothetical protein
MSVALALLITSAESDQKLYIILGIITLATLVAMGLKFFVNLFEIITAPTASIKHHGQTDNFFFSIVIVFLGGLIATFILVANQETIKSAFGDYAQTVAHNAAMTNSNPNYTGIAEEYGVDIMTGNFEVFFLSNIIFFPVVAVLLWLVFGLLAYLGARIFGGLCATGDFLGATAYSAFFTAIGFGLAALYLVQSLGVIAGEPTATPDIVGIIGLVLMLYGVILFLVAITQSAELTGGQAAGALIVMLIVLGGIGYLIYYFANPVYSAFLDQIRMYDPS